MRIGRTCMCENRARSADAAGDAGDAIWAVCERRGSDYRSRFTTGQRSGGENNGTHQDRLVTTMRPGGGPLTNDAAKVSLIGRVRALAIRRSNAPVRCTSNRCRRRAGQSPSSAGHRSGVSGTIRRSRSAQLHGLSAEDLQRPYAMLRCNVRGDRAATGPIRPLPGMLRSSA